LSELSSSLVVFAAILTGLVRIVISLQRDLSVTALVVLLPLAMDAYESKSETRRFESCMLNKYDKMIETVQTG